MRALAFDLGASSGRAVAGTLDDRKLTLSEIHRFSNDPVRVGHTLHWDILRLLHEIKQGMVMASHAGEPLQSMAIDSWAVDYGLIGRRGELLGNPYHYRDRRTQGMMEKVFQRIPKDEIFRRTGIQFQPFNTLVQLAAMQEEDPQCWDQAQHLLMIPDLLRYFLTGEMHHEFSNATTTQLYNPTLNRWDPYLLQRLQLPEHVFKDILEPGSMAGSLRSSITQELGISEMSVTAVAEHDTGSAVAAVPALEEDFVYISSGTWSLMGTEVAQPVLTLEAAEMNFTNEGGVGHTYRLLKNIMGLWIIQQCREAWKRANQPYTFSELVAKAETATPFVSFIDPDDESFLSPAHMPTAIKQYCERTGQRVPEDEGTMIRIVIESLALKYRYVMEQIERLTGKTYSGLHVVGGGIHNRLLCQMTANAIQRPVWAGPSEASSIGNIITQYMALGQIASLQEGRRLVRDSFPIDTYEPEQDSSRWEEAYATFKRTAGLEVATS